MNAQITATGSIGNARRQASTRIGIGLAVVALAIGLIVATQASVHRVPATTARTEQMTAQQRSPAVDAALLEATLDLGPVVGSVCTEQSSGSPACYQLHIEGIWTRQARQGDGTWLTVGLVIPRAEAT